MDTSVRHTTAIALLAVGGCGFSAASYAYSAADDAEAQNREVRAAYDRGYQAAKEEMAHAAATNAPATANVPVAAAPQAAGAGAPKPILDIKHTYSDAGEVQTVLTVPVTVKPLAEGQGAQVAAAAATEGDMQAAQPAAAAAAAATAAAAAEQTAAPADTAAPPATYQPKPRSYAQVPPNHHPVQAAAPAHEEVAPQDSLADDEAVDNEPQPRSAQIYSTQGQGYAQPPQPQAQYVPPPTASRPPPQPYNYAPRPVYPQQYAQQQPAYPQQYAQQQPAYPQQYAQQQYAQQPAYAPPRQAYYAPPPAPWGAQQYQPQPQTRWVYWSPQYGRWMYY